MYLEKLAIKNYGPIDEINIQFPFNENGSPKPVIFVGKNGTGKTILLSHIIDSFYEIIGDVFQDIKKYEGLGTKFFKISGGTNLKIGKEKGFVLLQYKIENSKIRYFDKVGKINIKDFKEFISDFDLAPTTENNEKRIQIKFDKQKLEEKLINGAYFYQPAYRYEEPFWKNDDFKHIFKFQEYKRFSGQYGKELEIINSIEENKNFILNLVLDYIAKISEYDKMLWDSVNQILNAIKKTDDLMFWIGSRANYRLSIVKKDGDKLLLLLPSINNLSLGELILIDMFINIIRHACIYQSKSLEDIEGIVVIDEIDVHLHSDLQFEILPKLIKLFPKVQFILTTHSPLFLLGMKKVFGENGFEIRNMPDGEIISIERFSEFENAFNYFKETEKFEKELKIQIEKANRPILLVEDEYYQIYQIAYLKLNDIEFNEDNLNEIFIKNTFFEIISGKGAGGVAGILRTKSPEIFKNKIIVGLFDFDKEGRENFYSLKKEKDFWTKEPLKDEECKIANFDGVKYKMCYKKRNDCDMYAFLLPIPERLQYLASLEWDNFISYIEVENLLPEEYIKNSDFFEEKKAPGSLTYYKCKKNAKNKLWKDLINLKKEDFKDFIPIFEFIKVLKKDN